MMSGNEEAEQKELMEMFMGHKVTGANCPLRWDVSRVQPRHDRCPPCAGLGLRVAAPGEKTLAWGSSAASNQL
jgi:hypothetical protein